MSATASAAHPGGMALDDDRPAGLRAPFAFDPYPFDDDIASGEAAGVEAWLRPPEDAGMVDGDDEETDYLAGEVPPLPLAA